MAKKEYTPVEQTLFNAKKRGFDEVIVIGVNYVGDNKEVAISDISATVNAFPWIHWVLGKADFELHILEKNNLVKSQNKGETSE